jgi:hypothetical protein
MSLAVMFSMQLDSSQQYFENPFEEHWNYD